MSDQKSPRCRVDDEDLAEILDLLANRWTVVTVTALEQGRSRFGEVRDMTGMSAQLQSKTLKRLEASGLVDRTVYAEVPPRVEYELSSLGESLCPVMRSINGWADEHADEVIAARAARAVDA
ncbi:winged helix-turn-helix transcriptional regulator [Demequina zhanjiangensis]|uniref:Helix-turn-helix domain-containing protein n=1 Tax=Demequina zhanjiangensis TaxID=3051659 RepID=A0ABT8G1J3_9MICO|nr:helix-turn-helix domain-containing protein [Demequina sp. SYSU T00b26]MDN4473010.1 helix-turn-helix domain-containing protein [Demequina sp. SYSU T00b26]